MKKVLFVATVTSHIKRFHEPYLKMLKEAGYKTYVAAKNNLKANEKITFCDEYIELPIERSPFKIKNIRAIKKLKKLIEKEKFDLIHCHTPVGAFVTRLAAKKARQKYGTRVIYTAHGFHFYKGAPIINWLLFYPVEKYLAKYTDTLITINKEDYKLAKKRFNKRCKNIEYVPGVGIDVKKFNTSLPEKEKNELRKSLGLNKSDCILICIARLDKNKNQGFLISVMKEITSKINNIHLLLVGPDELNGYYQSIVKKYNLNNNIHFLGKRDDIPQLLSISDIVVSASKREGSPVNIMEAFASGKPVVALNCRGMEDLIEEKKNGFIIKSYDVNAFDNYIKDIYNDIGLSKKIRDNNFMKIKKYDIKNIQKTMLKIYNMR